MTQSSWANAPEYDGSDPVPGTGETTVAQYRQQHSWYQGDGVEGLPSGTALKVTADGTDMQVDIAAGFAHVHGHPYENDAVASLTIGAAGGTTRYDAIVIRSDDSELAEEDRCVLAVVQNAGNPPTLTQVEGGVWEHLLAIVEVNAGVVVIASGKVTDARIFMGRPIPIWTDVSRPAGVPGAFGFNWDLGLFEGWDPNAAAYKPIAFGYEPIISATEPAVGPAGQQWIKTAS